jgi:hypothetical protein
VSLGFNQSEEDLPYGVVIVEDVVLNLVDPVLQLLDGPLADSLVPCVAALQQFLRLLLAPLSVQLLFFGLEYVRVAA